jgi:methylamine--corrinoid protein Co-methyltransferase
MGEVSKSVPGMKRIKCNEIAQYLLAKYESRLRDAPAGWTYEQLYDVTRETPNPEYLELYNEVKEELARLGLEFRIW